MERTGSRVGGVTAEASGLTVEKRRDGSGVSSPGLPSCQPQVNTEERSMLQPGERGNWRRDVKWKGAEERRRSGLAKRRHGEVTLKVRGV